MSEADPTLPTPAPAPAAAKRMPRRWFVGLFVALVLSQAFIGFMGAGDEFVLGHNGWNSSAYLQSARNTLRWGTLFPVQYDTGRTPPTVQEGYTHHPLAMHLHNTLAVLLFGDHAGTIRSVPAFFGVLALIALISVVRLLYDDKTALVAGTIYVLLPTNAIYTNMSNHENGFILWTLLWVLAHLRLLRARFPVGAETDGLGPRPDARGRWLLPYMGLLASFFWAAMWDWPAYYCALILAVHWLAVIVGDKRKNARPWRAMAPDLALLAGFSALVIACFVGHFVLVTAVVGSLSELGGVFEARQVVHPSIIWHHLKVVPILMFTAPLLVVAALWLGRRGWLAVRGRLARRDIVALTFALAGILHYYLFRGTAVIHEYWGWTLLPFMAIAGAVMLFAAIARLRPWLAAKLPRLRPRPLAVIAVVVPVLAIGGNLVWRFADLVPRGRAVGGSLWFIELTRPVLEQYGSTRSLVRFMHWVKDGTTRRVGVLVDPILTRTFGYEPRMAITLDREVVEQSLRTPPPERLGISEGWVYLGMRRAFSDTRLIDVALSHPVTVWNDYVLVDMRRLDAEISVLRDVEVERSWWQWYWGGPWADAVEARPDPDEEARLQALLDAARAAEPQQHPRL